MDLLEFFHKIGKLKDIERTGWKMRNIKNPESVSDHSYRLAMLVLVLAPKFRERSIDLLKALKMALLHDICEVHTGDICSRLDEKNQVISNKEKFEKEKEGMEKILSNLPDEQAKEFMELWLEFEERESKEAVFVKELDKLELALQTYEYESKGRNGKHLNEFYEFVETNLNEPELIELFEKIKKKRKKAITGN